MSNAHPRRLLLSIILALLLVLGATLVAPAASARSNSPEKADLTTVLATEAPAADLSSKDAYEVEETEEYWTMWDEGGTRLPVSVFTPVTDDPDARFPLIVFVHPWDLDKCSFEARAVEYASRGYVTLTYTVRGWYGAEGQISCMDPDLELRDLSHIITLASEDDRFPVLEDEKGPVVGVTGYSMGGAHTYLIAPRRDPREGDPGDERVRAVVPRHGGADLLFSLYPNGSIKWFWVTFLLGGAYMGNFCGAMVNILGIITDADLTGWEKFTSIIDVLTKWKPPLNDVSPDLPWLYGAATQRRVEDMEEAKLFMKRRSARYWADEELDGNVEHHITVPTLIVTGWKDDIFFANEGLRAFTSYVDAPKRIIITNNSHLGGYTLPIPIPEDPEKEWVEDQIVRWFDRYLKGVENGVEDDPRSYYYRDWEPERYGETDSWPLSGTREVPYYLGRTTGRRSGRLMTRRPGLISSPDLLVNNGIPGSVSLPAIGDALKMFGGEAVDIPEKIELFDLPNTGHSYTTRPLLRDVTVAGIPRLVLHYRASKPFSQITPRLYEVTPQGEEILVCRGWYEGHNEKVWSMSDTEDQPVEMAACCHRFGAGSRIKLELQTTDLLMSWPYSKLALILLYRNRIRDSRLVLPVVP